MDRSTRLIVLCICAAAITTAAAVSIDVGASAVNGVWRPSSCNDVKDGVVLTNIADNMRATIVGCTIVVDASASLTSSAVSIGNMGVNATLAFVDCTIRSTFATTATSWTQRHSTLRIATGSAGAGSHIVIRSTTVSFTETTSGKYGAAVMIDHGFTAGANFRFTVEDNSDIQASCVSSCIGVLILGTISGESTKTQLGPRSRFTIDASSVSASASTNTAYGVFFFNNILFGDDSRIAMSQSNVSVTVPTSSAHGFRFDRSIKFGKRCIVFIEQSRISATAGTSIAYSVSFYNPITFGASTKVAITASTLSATAGTASRGYNIVLWGSQIQYDGDHALTIDRSSLHSSANSGSGGIFFRSTDATSLAVTISASTVVFQSEMSGGSVPDTGVVVCHSDVTWSSVSLTVSSSQFTAGALMKAGVLANYVTWPKSIDGTSPQSFDVVTFTAPAAAGPIAAFAIQTGGTGPVGQITLCYRYLWGATGRIIPSPGVSLAFQTPDKEVCWPPTNTVTVSKSTTSPRSLTATRKRSGSNTATSTLPTATTSLAMHATTSAHSTVSGSPSLHASPTVSLRRQQTPSQSGSISAAISKTHTVKNETSNNSSHTKISRNTLTRTRHTSESETPTLKTGTARAPTEPQPRSATLSGVSPTLSGVSTTRTRTDSEHSPSPTQKMTSSPTLVDDSSHATITQGHPPDGPRAVLGAPTLPPATDAVARTATATSGAVAAFVGAGVSGATQAGRTLAIMQLVMCTAKTADDDAELETNNNAADPTATAPRSGVNGHRDESDQEDKGRPFPQALLPWIKLGDGDAGWSRGVVIGNILAVVLLLLLGMLVWAVLSKIVHRITVAKPDSFAARLGASAEDSAPPSANTAAVRMCRLLRFPGVAVTIPLAFATDGCIGESVALIRHGIEGRFGAGPFDIVFGSVAVLVAGLLWGALLYITVLVVPRNVHVVNAVTLTIQDHNPSSPHSSHTIRNGLSHHPPQASNRTSKLYSQARVLRDGSVSWAVLPDSTDGPSTTSASSSESHSFSSASPSMSFNDPFLIPCDPDPPHPTEEEKGRRDGEKWRCDQARQLESRHLFAARWAILFAPLHRRALPFTAIDCAASIAVATARGLRPRTRDGCQRALIAVAVAQVLLLVVILVLRPFLAPLKTAVSVAASGLLAAAAIVGAVAGSTEGGDRRSAEDAAVTAGYLAVAASVALLANPAMALWRVVEGRLIARKTDAAKTTDAAAGAFYELLHGDAGAPLLDPFGDLTTDEDQMLSPPAPIHVCNSIDIEMTTVQNCEVGGAEEHFTSPMSEERKSKEKQNRRVTFVSRVPSVESFLETAAAVMDDPTVSDEVAVGEEALLHGPSSNRPDQEEEPSFVWSDADDNDDGLPPECLPASDVGPFDPDDFNPLDDNVASETAKQRVVKEKAGKGAELAAELEEMLGSWR